MYAALVSSSQLVYLCSFKISVLFWAHQYCDFCILLIFHKRYLPFLMLFIKMYIGQMDENKQNYEILITSNSYQFSRVYFKYSVWVTLDLWVFLYGNVTSHHVCPLQITNIEEEMWEVQLREIVGIEKCCILISFPSLLNTPTYFTTSSSFSILQCNKKRTLSNHLCFSPQIISYQQYFAYVSGING